MNIIDSSYSLPQGLLFLLVNLKMSRKLLKFLTTVAAIIAVVILITCMAAIAITNGTRNTTLENEKSTKGNHIGTDKNENNITKNQSSTVGNKDGQTKETGIYFLDFGSQEFHS